MMHEYKENNLRVTGHKEEFNRRISFEGITNARDLGGLRGLDGRLIRTGCLLRTANLSRATDADQKKLTEQLHLSLVIDLRTPMAAGMKPDVVIDGVQYVAAPVFEDAMIGVTHESDRDYAHRKTMMPPMKGLYRMMVTNPECMRRFGRVLQMILTHDYEKGSVLWHCSEGKDRCGLTSAFVLTVLGVDIDDIIADYLITNETALAKADEYYRLVLQNGGEEAVAASVRSSFVVDESYLKSAFDAIMEQFGSIHAYLDEGLGIEEPVMQLFRERMLL